MLTLQLDEVRRLTGPSLLWDKSGAIIDVLFEGIEQQSVLSCLQKWVEHLLSEFDWKQESYTHRLHQFGLNFALSAPLDSLYSACDVLELAWDCTVSELQHSALPDWSARLHVIAAELKQEKNPAMLALMHAAEQHQVSCLLDDDHISLGMGATTSTWPVREIPDLESIPWAQYKDIPSALITGTNGKSTSVRLAAQMAKAAGICVGVTSTDFIRVGDEIIDYGDYSGPGGARMLLRDTRCELAVLEVARGGILRRGLPVKKVNAALITNVASDHLGQYGINTVAELAQTKFVVAKALDECNVLVLNADDQLVISQSKHVKASICWFSCDEFNPLIQQQLQLGAPAVFIRQGEIIYHHQGQYDAICHVSHVPMTLNGAAVHNVQNALGVVGLAKALHLPQAAIMQGLQQFGSDSQDNPGRGNVYHINGRQVIVDFAHNEHGMRAVVNMAKQLNASRYISMFSHAGDRSNDDMHNLTSAVRALDAAVYVIAELDKYLRGRAPHEVPALSRQFLLEMGVDDQGILTADSPLQGAQKAVAAAEHGDVVLLFVLEQRQEIHEWLLSQSEPSVTV
ncbi:MAG: Mur ligase family protein [Paraglaciecola polaris]|uniref:Mur ligase family protein n=1 Tax=Paraglaciecola polaris TaxID=222814 RepID=UPI003002070B